MNLKYSHHDHELIYEELHNALDVRDTCFAEEAYDHIDATSTDVPIKIIIEETFKARKTEYVFPTMLARRAKRIDWAIFEGRYKPVTKTSSVRSSCRVGRFGGLAATAFVLNISACKRS